MRDLGVRLQLYVGKSVPAPAPFEIVDALESLEVTLHDYERDGFQLSFLVGRRGSTREFALLSSGLLDQLGRVSVMVIVQGRAQMLINGMITHLQLAPSNAPGQSRLYVTGEDTTVQLDLKERSNVFRKLTDSQVVEEILKNYPDFKREVTRTDDAHVWTQQATDLALIKQLAAENSFVFFTEPAGQPGASLAYWGPRTRRGLPVQPPLTVNMGSDSNVDRLSFDDNSLARVAPETTVVVEKSGREVPIAAPDPLAPPLSKNPSKPLRTVIVRDATKLSTARGELRALRAVNTSADTVMGTGTLDAAAYGAVLRPRQRVAVRGVGLSYDGEYYVQQVTHRIKRGEYKQGFTLKREGRGATSTKVG